MKRVAIIGGGIAGLTAASEIARLARAGHEVEATLFEASGRLGGIVETVHAQGFTVELGPDAWVTEKPWARDLAIEHGLEDELIYSNDATRKTYILQHDHLDPIPDGMRLMVPTNLNVINNSSLFSTAAKDAYAAEITRAADLKSTAPKNDESIASFARRHFGEEVLQTLAAPLLSGVLGGDVEVLSARAVLAPFVAMEQQHGSLITALQARIGRGPQTPIFTTLRSGLGTLIERLVASLPPSWIRLNTPVRAISHERGGWALDVDCACNSSTYSHLMLAAPAHVATDLVQPLDPAAAGLMSLPASSAIVVALCLPDASTLSLPPGFGFLVPPQDGKRLLACTFMDQKFPHRLPEPTHQTPSPRLLRAFFGGPSAASLLNRTDTELVALARQDLETVLGPIPAASVELVRRWPLSLPQYSVGHLERMAELDDRIADSPGLTLLGNGYRGVGLPDLVRDARSAAQAVIA